MAEPAHDSARPPRPLIGIEEVAHWLGVDVRHVRRLVAERRIPFVKWGHLLRFDPDELQNWLEAKRVGESARHTSHLR
jgi:excisionase family DNA binding protein